MFSNLEPGAQVTSTFPEEELWEALHGYVQMIHTIFLLPKLEDLLRQLFKAGKGIALHELSDRTSINEQELPSIIRHFNIQPWFRLEADAVSLGPMGLEAQKDQGSMAYLNFICNIILPLLHKPCATPIVTQSTREYTTPFADDAASSSYFESQDGHEQQRKQFSQVLDFLGRSHSVGFHSILKIFDFSNVKQIVDVGGNVGHLARFLFETHPHLQIVVQDRGPIVIDGRQSQHDTIEWSEQQVAAITFQEHDFFEPQPEIADVYILRFILHDLDDEQAVRVLQNIAGVMAIGSRILIMEMMIDDIDDLGSRKIVTTMDRQMRVTFGKSVGERTRAQFEALIQLVPGLRWQSDTIVSGSVLHLIQVEKIFSC